VTVGRWLGLAVLALVFGAGLLFCIQNAARTTQLSLDLGFVAWQLERPVALPLVMGVCFLTGLGVGWVVASVSAAQRASRIRQLELNAAISGTGTEAR
jgi:hypothetical protein